MSELCIQFGDSDPDDFNEDIVGSPSFPSTQSDDTRNILPENFWFQSSSSFNLIRNNEEPGTVEDQFGQEVSDNEQKLVYQKVYRMGMQGVSPLELEKTLKLSFSSGDFRTKSQLQNCLYLLPMMGNLFWSCWPFRTEEDAKTELKRRNGLKPIFANQCSRCNTCRFRNDISTTKIFCSKLGLEIFDNNFSGPPPSCVISHLRLAGYLTTGKREYSWDEIRAALIFPLKNNPVRQYEAYTPPRKELLPGAKYRRIHREMNKLNNDLQTLKQSEAQARLNQTIIFPIIVKVQETILRNRQNDLAVNDAIKGMLLPISQEDVSNELVESLKLDVYLWAAIRWYMPPYKRCDDGNKFLRANHLRIPYTRERSECITCIDNKDGFCKRLESRLVSASEEIPLAARLNAIEFIGNDRGVDHGIIDHCKRLENTYPKRGLRKLREAMIAIPTVPLYTGAGIQDLDKLPVKQLDNTTCMAWIVGKLKAGNSVLKIELTMRQVFGEKKGEKMVQDAIFSCEVIPSDRNELCKTNYAINSVSEIGRLNRCGICSFADEPYCRKYNRTIVSSSTDIPPEVSDIMSYFRDQPRDVEVQFDPKRNDKPLDIEMENPGEHLPVDVRIEKPLDEQKIWYEAQRQELVVDAPAPVEFDEGLDIDMGEKGEGMVLGDDLL